ncbi:condensation domain-containing protein [Sinobacterium caligoides]|uniref:Condensation domain-containing protein n=1 Tax=Sinobacterium caligoides TaxID=933926 RepID=A0A3N2E0A5_9GAMM|nr:condensation domain-containing protein [Sinobacterium caligoides]ROS05541.1 condensation domain-containing protein [Sinobacterium caligoides]
MRQLGQREAKQAIAHQDNHGLMQISNVATIKGVVSAEKLLRAIHCAYQRHPLLRARIQFQQRTWHFIYDVMFDASQHRYQRKQCSSVEQEMADEVQRPLDQTQYLWRTRLVDIADSDESYLVLTTHHSMSDGSGCFVLINDIVNYYNTADDQGGVESLPERACLEDSCRPLDHQADGVDRREYFKDMVWPVAAAAPLAQRQPLIKESVFTKDAMTALVSLSRAAGVTLNAVISALLFRTTFQLAGAPAVLKAIVPKNMRPEMTNGVDYRELGAFFETAYIYADKRDSHDLLQLSKALRRQYQTMANSTEALSYAELADDLAQLGNDASTVFDQHLIISNLGRLSTLYQQGELSLLDYRFNGAIHSANYFLLCGVVTVNDALICSFNFTQPLVHEHTASRFVEQFRASVQQLVADYYRDDHARDTEAVGQSA